MRLLFALAGLHRIDRGAEVAFLSVAKELAGRGHEVTLAGSGPVRVGMPYRFLSIPVADRKYFEAFPHMPLFRDETAYEEASFAAGLLSRFRPKDYDVTLTCAYPFTNWVLRRPPLGGDRPKHIFVTQNGDWPARAKNREYRFFGCDGLVCINPDFHEANKERWFSALIPNGVDVERFAAAKPDRPYFGLAPDKRYVLMVSALIVSKRVEEAVQAVAAVPGLHLVVAGDGPERERIEARAQTLMPGRFTRMLLKPQDMPRLYASADLFLHMSKAEAFGNVFLEAMAAGLPIVAHDSARLRWIVGDCARLIATDDLPTLSTTLAETLPLDGEARARTHERAAQFGWAAIALSYERFLNHVLEGRHAAA